ncbi:MAG: hypothetical protein HY613_01805 [Candidatus Rokubacteria bacterium]|nr:hypothetical protein [Candidatus Rokubacteria bacterium]
MHPIRTGLLLAALLLAGTPTPAQGQLFLASRPHPEFMVGPLLVRATVTPSLGPVTVDIMWSLVIPPTRSAREFEQDLYLLWPGAVVADPSEGGPDPALARYVEARGFTVIGEGRLSLFAQSLYQMETELPPERVAGGAPFVTFVRQGGALGLTSPVTYVRILWTPKLVNRAWLMNLRMTIDGLIQPRKASWVENVFWGQRHVISISFNDVRHRALFPMYVEHRDQAVRLSDDPSQLLVAFADADHLKIEEVIPESSTRRLSESVESTEVVSLFLGRSEGITPQILKVQFGYFRGLQAWAPILIPMLFFILGNFVSPMLQRWLKRGVQSVSARVQVPWLSDRLRGRESGVVLSRDTLARIVPGETTSEDVLRLCGPSPEEFQHLGADERRTLVYRGRRVVPHRRRTFGWLVTVSHWDMEHHEVEIQLDQDRVRDVQARVRRSRLAHPETA